MSVEALSGGGEDGRGLFRGWKTLCRGAVILLSKGGEDPTTGDSSRPNVALAGDGALGSVEKVIDVAVAVDGTCWWW